MRTATSSHRHNHVVELMTAADDTGMTPLHVAAARYFALVHSFKACVMVSWIASIHSKSLCWVASIQRMSAPASRLSCSCALVFDISRPFSRPFSQPFSRPVRDFALSHTCMTQPHRRLLCIVRWREISIMLDGSTMESERVC